MLAQAMEEVMWWQSGAGAFFWSWCLCGGQAHSLCRELGSWGAVVSPVCRDALQDKGDVLNHCGKIC